MHLVHKLKDRLKEDGPKAIKGIQEREPLVDGKKNNGR